ncbi:Acid phosphatase Vanadium-dependent haloperoxidase [Rhizoctonia solani]|uniref:Acid phosphatase Vanadium-dependent haloperoxidase n=1 Tax=Rhizoctonia solani TaxID=456999 RepID=A0A8H7IJX3_9AGAM|nr:Acid phosphatase Vanadium-dependent haloperoxidase [Rhizoctonia solani]
MFRRNAAPAREKPAGHPGAGDGYGRRAFSFGRWLRLYGVDLITMAAMGAIGLGVYWAKPAPSRSFPVYHDSGEIVYPQFAYPLRKEIIPIWLAALIAFIVPFFFFCLFKHVVEALKTCYAQLWDFSCLSPNVPTSGAQHGNGFEMIMYDRSVCTGDEKEINDSLESMPSGHSTAGFAGLIYLALYLNAQLKVMSAHSPAYWKMVLFFAPVLGAVLIAGALTIDEFHNWYDVVAGGIIGTSCAIVAFRMTFASVWDFRFNHIRLPRTTSLFMRRPYADSDGSMGPSFDYSMGTATEMLPFTREGGWGWDASEGVNGAPFDAANSSGAKGASRDGHEQW